MEDERFAVESCIRGYHIYKDNWTPDLNNPEVLSCTRESGNIHDLYAVAIRNITNDIVGHVPRAISTLCSIFILQGGTIECEVTGDRRYSLDLPQGGLELPCRLTFITVDKDVGQR